MRRLRMRCVLSTYPRRAKTEKKIRSTAADTLPTETRTQP